MNQLEQRYRLVLRLLPAAYRRQWEEDMVAAFLMSMEDDDPERSEFLADFGRPSWSEIASVVGLAVRLHCGLDGVPSPRSETRVDAARIVVQLWLLVAAAWAGVVVGGQVWLMATPAAPELAPVIEPWRAVLNLTGLSWVVAYLALVFGRPYLARNATLVGVVANATAIVLGAVEGALRNLPSLTVGELVAFGANVCMLGAMWTFAPRWSPGRRTPWLLGLVGSVAVCSALMAGALWEILPWWAFDPVNLNVVAVLLLVAVRLPARAGPSWSLALAVLVWGELAVRVVTLVEVVDASTWAGHSPLAFAVAGVLALLVAAAPTTVIAVRTQSRLGLSAEDSRLGRPDPE